MKTITENDRPTPETDAHQQKEGMAHDHLWRDFAKKLERDRDKNKEWVKEGKINGARCAQERDDLLQAISNFKKAKGRFNTQLAAEQLIAMLPEFYQ